MAKEKTHVVCVQLGRMDNNPAINHVEQEWTYPPEQCELNAVGWVEA